MKTMLLDGRVEKCEICGNTGVVPCPTCIAEGKEVVEKLLWGVVARLDRLEKDNGT